jgi:O-antigen/teichoic acid export membrane protein
VREGNRAGTLGQDYVDTVKHGLVFGLGSLANKLIGFLLIPLYTRVLSPAEYGLFALTSVTGSVVGILLNMGLSSSVFRCYYASSELEERKRVLATALFWSAGSGVLFVAALWMLSAPLSTLIFGSPTYRLFLQIIFATEALLAAQHVPFASFRARRQSARYSVLNAARFVVGASLNILFIVGLSMGILGLLLAGVINAALFLVVSLIMIRDQLTLAFSPATARRLLSFGLPLVPAMLASYVLFMADRYFLQRLASTAEVGLYSLGYSFGSLIQVLVVQPFQLIWLPAAFEVEKRPHSGQFFAGALTYLLLIAAWLASALSLLGREALVVMATPAFRSAYSVIPLVAFSYVAYGAHMVVSIGFYLRDKTLFIPAIVMTAACVNIGLNFALIPRHGMLGAAWATLLSYLLLAVMSGIMSQRLYPLRYEWGRLIKIAAVTGAVLLLGNLSPQGLLAAVAFKIGLLLLFPLALWLTGFFRIEEKAFASRLLRRALRTKIPQTAPQGQGPTPPSGSLDETAETNQKEDE